MFNATFNNISATSGWLVILVEKTTYLPHVTDKLDHIMKEGQTIQLNHIILRFTSKV
jgi:hypothetical protein